MSVKLMAFSGVFAGRHLSLEPMHYPREANMKELCACPCVGTPNAPFEVAHLNL